MPIRGSIKSDDGDAIQFSHHCEASCVLIRRGSAHRAEDLSYEDDVHAVRFACDRNTLNNNKPPVFEGG